MISQRVRARSLARSMSLKELPPPRVAPEPPGLQGHPPLHPGEVKADEPAIDLDLVLPDGHLDARLRQQPFDERLEHPLGRRSVRITEGEEFPQHPGSPPPVAPEHPQALLHPAEELLVPAERRLHRRLDDGGVRNHGPRSIRVLTSPVTLR